MRTKEEIKAYIEDKLNSPTWNALKSSFIGRELIEYATSVAYLTSLQERSLQDSQYPDTADLQSLLLFSYNRDVAVDLHKPSYVKIQSDLGELSLPYQVVAKSGSLTFYNVDFISDTNFTLYQGTLKALYNQKLSEITETVKESFTVYYDSDSHSYYFKLGENALSNSVRVYKEDNGLILLSYYDPLRIDKDAEMVKVKRGYDGSLNVYFGDGSWAKEYDPTKKYEVVWLESTQTDFDYNSLKLQNNSQPINDFTVVSYDAGKSNDISYTRNQVNAAIAALSVAATESQIISFVKNYESVFDCVIDISNASQNIVTVYVKPQVQGDTIFDSVTDGLNLKGEIVTQYQVIPGTPLEYYVTLKRVKSISSSTRSEIEEKIRAELDYHNQPYISDVSTIRVNELANTVSKGVVFASLSFEVNIERAQDVIELPTRPYRGSIQIYRDDTLVGWDTEGFLYGAFNLVPVQLTNLIKLGDFFISCSDRVLTYDLTFSRESDNTGYLELSGVTQMLLSEGRALLKNSSNLLELEVNELFTDGLYSLQRNPTSSVSFRQSVESTLNLDNSLYLKDSGLFKVEKTGNIYYLYKYDSLNKFSKVDNFSVTVTSSGEDDWKLNSVGSTDGGMLIFFDKGLKFIETYYNPTSSAQDVKVDGVVGLEDQLENVVQVIMNTNIFVVALKYKEGENYIYELRRNIGMSVIGTTYKVLVAKTDLVSIYKEVSKEDKEFNIIYADKDVTYLNDKTSEIVYKIDSETQTLVSKGDNTYEIVRIGQVPYYDSRITIEGQTIKNVRIVYESADSLDLLPLNSYPVFKDIVWK